MLVQPYLSFEGRCEEALDFYRDALGAQVETLMRFKDMPAEAQAEGCGEEGGESFDPSQAEKVMHASFTIGDTTLMATDGRCQGPAKFEGISLTIALPDEATVDRYFAALAEGGHIMMPLARTFFSPKFGMLADRFGVTWMILMEGEASS